MKPPFQRVVLAAALGLGLAVSAAAQDRGPGPGGPPGPRGGDRQKLFEDMQHRREQRLHDLLQIKPDQEAAFRTFVSSLDQLRPQRGLRRDGAGQGPQGQGAQGQGGQGQAGPGRGRAQAERATLTAPERLDRSAQRLAQAQQRLQKEAAAVKAFYAALSPEQRKAFDSMPPMIGGGGGHGFGGRGARGRIEGPPSP